MRKLLTILLLLVAAVAGLLARRSIRCLDTVKAVMVHREWVVDWARRRGWRVKRATIFMRLYWHTVVESALAGSCNQWPRG